MSEIFSSKAIIAKKRDKIELSREEIDYFVSGLFNNQTNIEQLSSFCMAVYFNSMTKQETAYLTKSMAFSGKSLTWGDEYEVVDKHSTGGVGDKVSLVLAPLLAECNFLCPMISGRSLGHTGGTLDKLEAIPNYNTSPSLDELKKVIEAVGCAIIGQTIDLAPADKIIYQTRDICSSVESLALITSSILSKKKAAGIQNLVMDMKTGNGAFVNDIDFVTNLANSIKNIGKLIDIDVTICLTDMNQVLGHTAGNGLEVIEVCDWLRDNKPDLRLKAVVYKLATILIRKSKSFSDLTDEEITKLIDTKFAKGLVAERFEKMIAKLGGPKALLSSYNKDIKTCNQTYPVLAENSGYVGLINTKMLGEIVNNLGGGRITKSDKILHEVGLSNCIALNTKVETKQELCIIHCDDVELAKIMAIEAQKAYTITSNPTQVNPLFPAG